MFNIAFDFGIELYFLPAHTSHFLQQMDQTFFVLKSKFSNLAYSSLVMRPDLCVSKRTFTSFLKYSFKSTYEGGQLLREGFKRTGVNPTTIDGIDKSKVLWKKGMYELKSSEATPFCGSISMRFKSLEPPQILLHASLFAFKSVATG